jgi:hypothetical protein
MKVNLLRPKEGEIVMKKEEEEQAYVRHKKILNRIGLRYIKK